MKLNEKVPLPKLGRPLSFDRQVALHRAMLLFWRQGYETTSLSDLTGGLGVTAPSIYAAFGSKKGLFLEAVKLYTGGPVTAASIIDEAASSRIAALNLLRASAIGFTGVSTPPGCLLASSTTNCSAGAADVQRELAGIRRKIESQLKKKIQEDIVSGRLSPQADASALAAHTMAVIQGMSSLARDGAKRPKLLRVTSIAMGAWPPD